MMRTRSSDTPPGSRARDATEHIQRDGLAGRQHLPVRQPRHVLVQMLPVQPGHDFVLKNTVQLHQVDHHAHPAVERPGHRDRAAVVVAWPGAALSGPKASRFRSSVQSGR